jgi:hypothetical protein
MTRRAKIAAESTERAPAIFGSKPKTNPRAIQTSQPNGDTPALLATIKTLGELLDDLEATRIANGNRIGALEREHGEALPHLDVIQKQLKVAEHLAELELKRVWRKHPLAPWAKQFHGVGEKSIARLIANVGDPAERPNVAKLWSYCGHGDANRKRRKAKTEGRLHAKPCVRCGPSGSPAAEGSPWSDAHRHADALRYAGKQFLKELWIASRHASVGTQHQNAARHICSDSHLYPAGQDQCDTHNALAREIEA